MKKYIFIISLTFIACQEEITLDLPQANNQLVVEGAIESGYPPYVILTKNQGYFDEINASTYNSLFVYDADSIKVWYEENNQKIIRYLSLIPIEISENLFSIPFPVYTVTDISDTSELSGNYNFSQSGRTYFLEIKWNNKIITSSTTIPEPTPLDCLWVEKNETAEKEHKCDIRAILSDDGSVKNNIIVKSKRLEHWRKDTTTGEATNKPDEMLSIIDAGTDVLFNGEAFETYFPRPNDNGFPTGKWSSDRYAKWENNNITDSIFLKHDVALIKFCQIDEASLKFWRSLVRQFGTNGNPFAEPMNLVGNINNGLGVWTGYGAVYYKVPIIKQSVIYQQYKPSIIDIF